MCVLVTHGTYCIPCTQSGLWLLPPEADGLYNRPWTCQPAGVDGPTREREGCGHGAVGWFPWESDIWAGTERRRSNWNQGQGTVGGRPGLPHRVQKGLMETSTWGQWCSRATCDGKGRSGGPCPAQILGSSCSALHTEARCSWAWAWASGGRTGEKPHPKCDA